MADDGNEFACGDGEIDVGECVVSTALVAISDAIESDRERIGGSWVVRGVEIVVAGQPGESIQDGAEDEPRDDRADEDAESCCATDPEVPVAQIVLVMSVSPSPMGAMEGARAT